MLKKVCSLFSIIFCLLVFHKPVFAIDCKKATTSDEKIICKSEQLIKYDDAMSQIYNAILPTLIDSDKKKYISQQKAWLKQRATQKDEQEMSEYYILKIRHDCHTHEKLCKNLAQDILNKWQNNQGNNEKNIQKNDLNEIDSIIVSSYLKGNLSQYIEDKKALKEVREDISSDSTLLDYVELHKLANNNILVTVPLFMAAYQGQSMSFLYNNGNFQVVRFPVFEGKLIYPFTHMNNMDWDDTTLRIHNRAYGFLYDCGTTQYYQFLDNAFTLIKQISTPCTEKELDAIHDNKLKPENLKQMVDYPK